MVIVLSNSTDKERTKVLQYSGDKRSIFLVYFEVACNKAPLNDACRNGQMLSAYPR